MRKKRIAILSLVLILAPNIYYRCYPVFFPQLKSQARNTINNNILNAARVQVEKKFPDYASSVNDGLSRALLLDYIRHNKIKVREEAWEEYRRLKSRYQDPQGQTYLLELDGWHWARYVDNILRHGYPGDSIRGGRQVDDFMLAPSGCSLSRNNFFFYLSAFLYKAFSLFKPLPLITFLFYLPLFFIALLLVLLYLFCLSGWDNITAFVACLFVGFSPIFLVRSSAGWFDNDILNLIFPLLVIWAYLKNYSADSLKKGLPWVAFSAFWVGLFCFSWANWWFVFIILVIYECYSIFNLWLARWQYKDDNYIYIKKHAVTLFLFIFLSLGWVVVFSGLSPLRELYHQVRDSLILNRALTDSIWPNVYSTVGELKKTSFTQLLNSIGGMPLFLLGMAFLLVLFLVTARNKKYTFFQREAITVLTFWFIAMLFACRSGIRFSVFLLIPLGVAFGWGISEIYRHFRLRRAAPYLLAAAVIFLGVKLSINARHTAENTFPFMDDNWHSLLTAIKENTPRDAILNSWWDFGDWFKTVAGRRVIFDGQSQNTPQAYWMASCFITNDEDKAIATLRMLNNGGNRAFEIINRNFQDPLRSVNFLRGLLSLDENAARKLLDKSLPSGDAAEVAGILSRRPAEAYFIVDQSLLEKASPVSFIGNWDFNKAYIKNNINSKSRQDLVAYLIKCGVDEKLAEKLCLEAELLPGSDTDDWLSKRLKFRGGVVKGYPQDNDILFNNGMIYKPKQQQVYVYSGYQREYSVPKSLFLFSRGRLKEISYPNSDLDYSVIVFKDKKQYYAIALDRELAASMLVRLYFFNGEGLKHFEPFLERKEYGSLIRVFKINW
ncbi:MAG: STT3 domain-containing protein [Candidatus Omnitrophota bacterium]